MCKINLPDFIYLHYDLFITDYFSIIKLERVKSHENYAMFPRLCYKHTAESELEWHSSLSTKVDLLLKKSAPAHRSKCGKCLLSAMETFILITFYLTAIFWKTISASLSSFRRGH